MSKATIEIVIVSANIIMYTCSKCDKQTPVDKNLLRFDRCPRCGRKFKNKAKIIKGEHANDAY